MTSGIYRITHIPTQRHYVGSTVNIQRRWNEHRARLIGERHPAIHLVHAFRCYGLEQFEFVILEECDCHDDAIRIERENHWITVLKPVFNYAPAAGSIVGIKRTDESRKKMSEAQKARYAKSGGSTLKGRPRSEEARAAISAGKLGKSHAPQHLANLSAALKGRVSPRKGIVMTQEQKDKISTSKTGKKQTPESVAKRTATRLANKLKRIQNAA